MIVGNSTFHIPDLYAKQRDALFNDARYSVVEASTKSGKTVGCICWLIAEAIRTGKDGRNYWWVAPIFSQTEIAFRRMARMFRRADPQGIDFKVNQSKLTITLSNGAVMWFKSGDDADSLYGEDVYAAVIDEATRVSEDSWFALRTTLTATRGPIRIIGNIKGSKNWMYQMARKAQAGARDMHYAKIIAADAVAAGVLDQEEIDDAKRTLPENVFKELYLAEPSADGGNPFNAERIMDCLIDERAAGPVAHWGVDLAESQDWTVAIGLNEMGRLCAMQRWQMPWMETERRLGAMLRDAPSMVDCTGVGKPVVERMQSSGCPVSGYPFTPKSKQELIGGLAVAIQNREIRFTRGCPAYPEVLLNELNSFTYEVKVVNGKVTGVSYSAPPGMWDDCVCALALAVQCRGSHVPVTVDRATYDVGVDTYASDYDPHEDERLWTPA